MSHEVGDRTQLVDSGRPLPRVPGRPAWLAWLLLAITLTGGGLTGWILWEQGALARDEVAAARLRLDDANRRAAWAEGEVLAMEAAARRPAVSGALAESAAELVGLAEVLGAAVDEAAGRVAVDEAAGRLVVTLDDPDLFRTGDADLTRRGDGLVVAVARALVGAGAGGDRGLWIHGHVDDAPLADDAPFETAWELSSARALSVVRRLAEEGVDGRRLAGVAFGAERPAGQDRAKNRRIEIVVEGVAPVVAAAAQAAAAAAQAAARSAGTRSR